MHPDTALTMQSAMTEIAREVIETVADRPGDSQARRIARQQMTAWSISSFEPRDPVETMLAGHCVIFDHLLRDGACDTLRGQQQDIKVRVRPQVLATGKMFLAHLDRFERLQGRLLAVLPAAEQTESPSAGPNASRDAAARAPAEAARPPVPGRAG